MIKGLRKKFIVVGLLSVIIAELLMIGAIDAINYKSTMDSIRGQMAILVENKGDLSNLIGSGDGPGEKKEPPAMPDDMPGDMPGFSSGDERGINEETPFMLRYFTVTLDDKGEVTTSDTDRIAMIDSDRAKELGKAVYEKGSETGFLKDYYYNRISVGAGDMIIFLECRRDMASFESFRNISIIVGLIGAILVFIILVLTSGRVTAPVEESYRKQKRFITDASHEIKTPLAIISADAEVLELDNEGNEWIESIKNQTKRLSELTEKLVFLSRMDEGATNLSMEDMDLSELMYEVTDSYKPMAEATGKKYILDIEYDVHITGDAANITQMLNLLIDNAFKYSNEGGDIKVSLKSKGKKRLVTVYNTVDSIEKGKLNNLFERFYRADTSHNSSTGGHGIGLSVVAAIAAAHGGHAEAESRDGRSVVFTVVL